MSTSASSLPLSSRVTKSYSFAQLSRTSHLQTSSQLYDLLGAKDVKDAVTIWNAYISLIGSLDLRKYLLSILHLVDYKCYGTAGLWLAIPSALVCSSSATTNAYYNLLKRFVVFNRLFSSSRVISFWPSKMYFQLSSFPNTLEPEIFPDRVHPRTWVMASGPVRMTTLQLVSTVHLPWCILFIVKGQLHYNIYCFNFTDAYLQWTNTQRGAKKLGLLLSEHALHCD